MVRTPSQRPLDSAAGRRLLSGALACAAGMAGPGAAAVALVVVGVAATLTLGRPRHAAWLMLPGGLVLGAAAGAIHVALDPVPALMSTWQLVGFEERVTPIELEGRLLDLEPIPGDRLALTMRLLRWRLPSSGPQRSAAIRRPRLRLTLPFHADEPLRWIEGDRVRLSGRLGRPRSFRNPAAFDYGAYLRARGVQFSGTVKSPLLVERLESGRWRSALPTLRRRAVANLRQAAGTGGEATSAFLAALLLGERQSLPAPLEEALQRSGVYHILALSGFNVGLVVMVAAGILTLLPIGGRARRVALLLAVLLYWGTVRHGGSIARASLMVVVHLAGALLGRRVAPLGALSVSGVLLLAWRPDWISDAGFQLSYAATLGLMAVRPPRPSTGASRSPGAARRMLTASCRASGAALLATAPFTARHFHALAPVALLANLIVVPLGALSLVLALLIELTASWAPGAAVGAAAAAGALLRLLEWTVRTCAAIPGGFLFVLPPPLPLTACLATALSLLSLARRRATRWLAAGPTAAFFLLVLLGGRTPRDAARLEVIALDVGQGDAVLTRFPNGLTLLCDAGGILQGEFDLGARVVAPALRGLGLLSIDILAITHAHRDHLGGALSVMRQFRPRALWLGAMPVADPVVSRLVDEAEAAGVAVVRPRRGVRLELGGGRLEVLHPVVGESRSGFASNDDSLVLKIAVGERAALLTGDAEAGVEDDLIREHPDLAADLLKVAHHGSASSTGRRFLEQVSPRLALISVGQANPFRHPSSEVLARLGRRGACVLRTDRDGAVGAWTDGRGPWRAAPLGDPGSSRDVISENLRCGGDEADDEDEKPDERQDVACP